MVQCDKRQLSAKIKTVNLISASDRFAMSRPHLASGSVLENDGCWELDGTSVAVSLIHPAVRLHHALQ